MKTAIVLGATGLTGGLVLNRLLKDEEFTSIKIFNRSPLGAPNTKVEEHIVDLMELENYQKEFAGDVVFCCVGSTRKKTPDLDVYREVDYGIPLTAAKLAKENGIKKVLIVSALGANPESQFFYNRTKGEMERDILKLGIRETYFFEPSLIRGNRKEKRTFESLWNKVMLIGNFLLIGPLKKYKSIAADDIAKAMVKVAKEGYKQARIESDQIKLLAKKETH